MLNAEEATKRYLDGVGSANAKAKYQAGVDAVTDSPMAKAAAADQLYLDKVRESVESGRRARALMAVPLQRWKDQARNKGAERLAGGARAAVDKVRAHFQKWAPIYQQIKQEVAGMPKGTIEDSLARVRRSMEIAIANKGK
jgi:hypothetical protein